MATGQLMLLELQTARDYVHGAGVAPQTDSLNVYVTPLDGGKESARLHVRCDRIFTLRE